MSEKIAACETCNCFVQGFDGGESCPSCGTSLVVYVALSPEELAALRASITSARAIIEGFAIRGREGDLKAAADWLEQNK